MTTRIIRRSYSYGITLLVLMIFVFILGIFLLYRGEGIFGTVLSIGTFISIVMVVRGLMNNQPRITMDQEGIIATEFRGIKILWNDIEKVNIIRRPRVGRIITFKLFDEAKYAPFLTEKQKLGQKVNRIFEVSSFAILAEGLDTHPSVIHSEILKRIGHQTLP